MKNKRSETAAYHRWRVAAVVGPKAEPKILINLEGSDRVHPTKKFIHVHLEGGDAARIATSGHITDAVATPLQRKDPAGEPSSHHVGSSEPFSHQFADPRHLAVDVGVSFTRFLRPVVLGRRRQRELREVQQIPVFIWGSGYIEETHLP